MQVPDGVELLYLSEADTKAPAALPQGLDPALSAYIILTSGTTGEPKGVEVTHAAAWNTIRDVNERISANAQDSLLALASIDFDLSVYILPSIAKHNNVVLCSQRKPPKPHSGFGRGRINEALSGTQCRPAVKDGGLQIVITICNSA